MSLAQREKGRRWAAQVKTWLEKHGVAYVRDHTGLAETDFLIPNVCLEAKNQNRLVELGTWMNQAQLDALEQGRLAAVLHHRRGCSRVSDAYVTMRADDWMELYQAAVDPPWPR